MAGRDGKLDALQIEVLAKREAADVKRDTQASDHLKDGGLDVGLVAPEVVLRVRRLGRRVEAAHEHTVVGIDPRVEEGAVDRLGQQATHGRGRVDRGGESVLHGQERAAGRGDAGVHKDLVGSIEPEDPLHLVGGRARTQRRRRLPERRRCCRWCGAASAGRSSSRCRGRLSARRAKPRRKRPGPTHEGGRARTRTRADAGSSPRYGRRLGRRRRG